MHGPRDQLNIVLLVFTNCPYQRYPSLPERPFLSLSGGKFQPIRHLPPLTFSPHLRSCLDIRTYPYSSLKASWGRGHIPGTSGSQQGPLDTRLLYFDSDLDVALHLFTHLCLFLTPQGLPWCLALLSGASTESLWWLTSQESQLSSLATASSWARMIL